MEAMSLIRLHVFVNVVERGGYSAAAAYLNMSQPSVSSHIRALEKLLGVELILYRGHEIVLTAAGDSLYRSARQILRAADLAVEEIKLLRSGLSGRLDIGISGGLEQPSLFARVLAPYYEANSN